MIYGSATLFRSTFVRLFGLFWIIYALLKLQATQLQFVLGWVYIGYLL